MWFSPEPHTYSLAVETFDIIYGLTVSLHILHTFCQDSVDEVHWRWAACQKGVLEGCGSATSLTLTLNLEQRQ